MKPVLILVTFLSVFFNSTKASDDLVSPTAQQSFKRSFVQAKDVRWVKRDDFYRVDFQLNSQYITAFYSPEGKFVAATRNVTSEQLPMLLQTHIKKHHADYWISDLFEFSNDQEVTYFLTLENADVKLVLQSSGNYWNVYQRTTK